MKTIAKYLGGSASYGLLTSQSDQDIRFLFINTEISKIIGLDRHDHQNKLSEGDDIQGFELRHFLNLLKKGNTQCLELVNNNIWLEKTPEFDLIQSNQSYLISSEQMFKCLRGYIQGEKHIITGTNTKQLGAKRKEQIEKYGYSYRNCVHAIRLLRTGILFFRDNIYPVNIVEQDKEYGAQIKDIKFNPQNYKVDNLMSMINALEQELVKWFDLRPVNYKYNEKVANDICFQLYYPTLKSYHE